MTWISPSFSVGKLEGLIPDVSLELSKDSPGILVDKCDMAKFSTERVRPVCRPRDGHCPGETKAKEPAVDEKAEPAGGTPRRGAQSMVEMVDAARCDGDESVLEHWVATSAGLAVTDCSSGRRLQGIGTC